jgi:hypothetical protein
MSHMKNLGGGNGLCSLIFFVLDLAKTMTTYELNLKYELSQQGQPATRKNINGKW